MIFLLFDIKNAVVPSHTKSIHTCNTNTIKIPTNAHIAIASEINFKPIVNHQIIKNGFNALSKTPVMIGPCFSFVSDFSFFFNVDLICINANTKSVIAPKIEIIILNSGKISSEKIPIPNKIINGNSTSECPIAIFIPALVPYFNPYVIFAANNGPGDITPDAEIIMTIIANSMILLIILSYVSH